MQTNTNSNTNPLTNAFLDRIPLPVSLLISGEELSFASLQTQSCDHAHPLLSDYAGKTGEIKLGGRTLTDAKIAADGCRPEPHNFESQNLDLTEYALNTSFELWSCAKQH